MRRRRGTRHRRDAPGCTEPLQELSNLAWWVGYSSRRCAGATLRQASNKAPRSGPTLAARRFTFVHPWRPQPPLMGSNAAGSDLINSACCWGVSFTMPQASLGPSVAKILPPTRKSGCPMCDDSITSSRLRARLRNLSAVIASFLFSAVCLWAIWYGGGSLTWRRRSLNRARPKPHGETRFLEQPGFCHVAGRYRGTYM